ncbi:hypothetical protein SDC9_163013 [bioreactor metagenome]|uniref:Uncharacterized protein n=1 Tax=bioreactor metagenome TaxID=1076179 RepID=A0A645FQL6_9ZZZZ
MAVELIAAALGNLPHLLCLTESQLRLFDHLAADQAGADEALAALEKLHAKLILEAGNGHAQGRLADGTTFCRPTEISILGQGHDVAQFGQCHAILPKSGLG